MAGFSSGLSDPLCFRGSFQHSVDVKGRVSLPVDFRRVLDERGETSVVITNYVSEGARCLEGFALSAWQAFEEKLKSKSRFSTKLQKLENFYLSRAAQCELDRSGRVLLPGHLRAYASLEKDIAITSSIHGFRMWDLRVWNVIFEQTEQELLENPELFADVDI